MRNCPTNNKNVWKVKGLKQKHTSVFYIFWIENRFNILRFAPILHLYSLQFRRME
jgi:hypothetical protein